MISVEFKWGKGRINTVYSFSESRTYQIKKDERKDVIIKYDYDSSKIIEVEKKDNHIYKNVDYLLSKNKDKLLRVVFKESPVDPSMDESLYNIKYILLLNPELKNYSFKSLKNTCEVSFKFDCCDEFITRDILE